MMMLLFKTCFLPANFMLAKNCHLSKRLLITEFQIEVIDGNNSCPDAVVLEEHIQYFDNGCLPASLRMRTNS